MLFYEKLLSDDTKISFLQIVLAYFYCATIASTSDSVPEAIFN